MAGNKKKEQQENKIMRENQSIASFLPPTIDNSLETRQPKRMQIFRNFSLYYPPYDKSDRPGIKESYFRFMFDKIEKAQFPYVLTNNKFDIQFK